MSRSEDLHNGKDTDASEWEPARQLSIRKQTPAQLGKEGLGNKGKQHHRIRYRKQSPRDKAKKRTANAATGGSGPEQHLTSKRKKDHRAPRLDACALVQPCDEEASTSGSARFPCALNGTPRKRD